MQLSVNEEERSAILDQMGHEPCPGVEIEFERELRPGSSAAPRQWATIYRPANAWPGPRPCLLAFHGGGFRLGDPNGNGAIAKLLALKLGVVTVSVSYRLGMPEQPTGTGILEDASSAWSWVQAHAGELNVNPACVAVQGESAGCLLAGHLAVGSPWVQIGGAHRPAALISFWGPLDLVVRWYDNGENNGAEDAIFGPGGFMQHPSLYHQLSALAHIVPGRSTLPPALFVYGRNDPVVHARQGRVASAAWKAASGYSEELCLPNIGHGVEGDNRPQREQALRKALVFSEARWALPTGG